MGKGWASFFLEDYSMAHEFRIFGEEYLRFKHFLVPNSFLHVRISCRKNFYNDDVRLQFTEVHLLQDVLEKMSNKVTIQLEINDIDNKKLKLIQSILTEHKGTKPLHFTVYDTKEEVKLNLPSRTHKVSISNELLSTLKKEAFRFKLN